METGFPPDSGWDQAARAGLPPEEGQTEGNTEAERPEGAPPDDATLIRLAKAAENQAVTFANENWRNQWRSNYKQFRSEYTDNSKYKSADYRHRSKIFRPKTRIAVTKDMAAAAETLFATVDSVTVTASDETSREQVANAELQRALLNYRLDRTSGKNAIPWFMTAMGARQDCQIVGICVSKQFWTYRVKRTVVKVPIWDEATGEVIGEETQEQVKVVRDKPECDLVAPENVGMDAAASWVDPVNSGAYFYVRYPMRVRDVKNMMKDPRGSWRNLALEDKDFTAARVRQFESADVRRAREGGTDRMDNDTSNAREFDVVWVVEWFIRDGEDDWNFWTLGNSVMLSDPVPTEESYPWRGGERPYRIGYGNIEAHRIVPQSPVETLTPLQLEINDITNLRLDCLKQSITPVAKVVRGKKIDTEALKRRYPVLYVDNVEDVEWDRPPEGAASSFAETSRLDTDFDDLAGTFNGGSVANNRQVGETVGGMRLMAGSASAISRFYMRLFIETWVEPVLSDIAKLEAYYESDEKILALAQKRAPAMAKFGIDELTDDLLMEEVIVRVSAGSADQQAKMTKLATAIDLTGKMVQVSTRFKTGEIRLKEEALINEIWGSADIRDAFDRFFEYGEPMPPPDDAAPQGASPEELAAQAQEGEAQRQHDMKVAKLKARTDVTKALIGHRADQSYQRRDHRLDARKTLLDVLMEAVRETSAQQERAQDREMAARQPQQPPAFPQ